MAEAISQELRYVFPRGELDRWLVLGGVTDGNVRVWLRAPGLDRVPVRASDSSRVVAEGEIVISPEHDHIGILDLDLSGAPPNVALTLEAAGIERMMRTAPRENQPHAFSFAFGSCNQPFDAGPDQRMESSPRTGIFPLMNRVLRSHNARFVGMFGDQMYTDEMPHVDVRAWAQEHEDASDAELLEIYRHLYRGYFNEPGTRGLMEAFPAYLIWDDHEIFNSWGSQPEPTEMDQRLFRAATAAYVEYQHTRNPGTTFDDTAPFQYQFWYADVGFFVLDLRGERSYAENRIIGEAQWLALERFLKEASTRDVRTVFIVATIPVVHFSPAVVRALDWLPGHQGDNVRDRWDATGVDADRDRLLDTLFDWQGARSGRHALILSGDVHAAAAFNVYRKGFRHEQISQWTSSAFTSPGGMLDRVANALGTRLVNLGAKDIRAKYLGTVKANNFGLVEISPATSGGHNLRFTAFGHDARQNRLRRGIRTIIRPTR